MLRISKLTDYGLVISSRLAKQPELASVSNLALETGIPTPTVSKILKQLVRAHVVQSVRGSHGGYRLARDANEIGVDEVIAAIEGPIAVTECSDTVHDSECEYEPTCDLSANWKKINLAVQRALSQIKLTDIGSSETAKLISVDRLLRQSALRRVAS